LCETKPVMSKTLSLNCLAVLAACEVVGSVVFIRSGNLDRKLYQEVNAALESIGGKWDRKAKGHVFESGEDAEDALELMLETGEATRPINYKQAWQFFPTPEPVVDLMIEASGIEADPLAYDKLILEPSAGDGAIVKKIAKYGRLTCVEKQPELVQKLLDETPVVVGMDFLDYTADGLKFDYIFMNPPFCKGQDAKHIKHAYSMLKEGGRMVAIAGAGVDFRNDGAYKGFREWLVSVGGRIEKLPEGAFKSSGTMVNSLMVVI
jgi:hypothetical protein